MPIQSAVCLTSENVPVSSQAKEYTQYHIKTNCQSDDNLKLNGRNKYSLNHYHRSESESIWPRLNQICAFSFTKLTGQDFPSRNTYSQGQCTKKKPGSKKHRYKNICLCMVLFYECSLLWHCELISNPTVSHKYCI